METAYCLKQGLTVLEEIFGNGNLDSRFLTVSCIENS